MSELRKLALAREGAGGRCGAMLADLFGPFFPAAMLCFKASGGACSRVRTYPPAVVFWAFLGQVLAPGSSCRAAVAGVQTLASRLGLEMPACDTGAYCRSRLRLPVRLLRRIHDAVAARLCASRPGGGGRTVVVDGTTFTMPDTPDNQRKYPQTGSQKPGCGFPIMRIVGLFCLDTGAWIACAKGHYKVSEGRLFRRLLPHLRPGDTLVADRGFCSYAAAVALAARGVDIVMRNHHSRRSDFRSGLRLGCRDHLVIWEKPARPAWMGAAEYAALPEEIVLRETLSEAARKGFRTRRIIAVSSFLHPAEKSAAEIGSYYTRRWRVELYFDDIKTTMRMDVLRTKSPAMVCRELLMHMIAYNLVRSTIARSGADPGRASFKGTADRIATWSRELWAAPTKMAAAAALDALLETVAEDAVPERPGRREPRVIKRRKKPYQIMTEPRKKMKEIPHRSNYKKAA